MDFIPNKVIRLLRPNRYILAIFLFFALFPIFLDIITTGAVSGYAGGIVDAQGETISRYEGGSAPQYQWYYPILYPFMLIWYVAVLIFDIFDIVIPDISLVYYSARLVYFYIIAVIFGNGIRLIILFVRQGISSTAT